METLWWKKRVSPWITYPVLVFFSFYAVAVFMFFYIPHSIAAQASYLQGFEGTLSEIEYNCLCNFGIMLTVNPTEASQQQGAQQVQLMYYYLFQILEELGIEWEIDGIQLPIPRMYLWTPYVAYDQQVLGNYVPGSFTCWAYTGEGCAESGEASGAILNIGSALFAE